MKVPYNKCVLSGLHITVKHIEQNPYIILCSLTDSADFVLSNSEWLNQLNHLSRSVGVHTLSSWKNIWAICHSDLVLKYIYRWSRKVFFFITFWILLTIYICINKIKGLGSFRNIQCFFLCKNHKLTFVLEKLRIIFSLYAKS